MIKEVLFVNSVLSLIFGLFVFSKGSANRVNRLYLVFTFLFSLWSFSFAMMLNSAEESDALFWGKLLFSAAIFIPVVHCQATLSFAGRESANKKVLLFFFSLSFLFLFSILGDHLIKNVRPILSFRYYTEAGILMFPFLGFFLGIVLFTLYELNAAHKTSPTVTRRAISYVAASWVIGYLGGSTSFFPTFNMQVYPFGVYIAPFYFVITGYAIVKYKFMDISTVLHKTIMWITTSLVVLFPIVALFGYTRPWLNSLNNFQSYAVIAIVFSAMIPYIRFIQPRIDHLFERRKYDMQKILQGMVQELAALKSLDGLISKIADTIHEALYVSKITLILWDDKNQAFKIVKGDQAQRETLITPDYPFLSWMNEQDAVIEWEEIEFNPKHEYIRSIAKAYFERFEAKVVLPLIHDGRLIGIVNLGEKANLKSFSKMDLDFLSNLRAEASIALSNSFLYDDVSKMSEELRQWANELERKVDERTRELAESKHQLEDSYQKLQELDQIKSKFFANISHELRTPITLILAPTEMMLNRNLGDLTKEQEKYLTIMQTNSLRLLKLINNLLDLAKVDAGKMELYYNRADFAKYVNEVVFSISPMAEKKSLRLKFSSEKGIPEFFFDADKIEKVILNLVFNALKFTERGEINVSCAQQDNQVLVKVSDTGIGIPKGHMPKLFSRFSQADSSASRKYEGTGIGLALARELVELHHGKIWAESEEGRGTTFFFTIPIYTRLEDVPGALDRRTEIVPVPEKRREEDWAKSLETQADYATAGIVQESAPLQEEPGADKGVHRILLVDDNPDMLSYVASQLKKDYQLLFAKDGKEGVDRAKSDIPDLIISDVMMPYKDGYQLCREVKEEPRTCHIPIILLTAKTDLSTKIEGLELGADDYLTKPFNSQELRARVRSLISLRKLEREIQLRSHQLEETLQELKETQGHLVQSEKMAALGLLVAGVAHEINNPVSFAKGSLAIVRRSLDQLKSTDRLSPAEISELLEDIDTSVRVITNGLDRTENIIRNLKSFVRKDEEILKPFDIHEGFESTLQLFQHEISHRITIHREYGTVPPIEAIPGQINQAFMNVVQNAAQAIPERGDIFIKTEQQGDHVKISIRDTGSGIAEKDLSRIFDPFFTTKDVGKGTGLGMTITYKIIETHHGKIEVKSKTGSGTEVTITLPLSQPSASDEKTGRGLYAGSTPV
ncbi:MAG: response regulator [Candidatus Manganitrophaceae bacterium]|nr:MAG: response regulator [Candidatus Manganitrophaceae bacterium]